ncbi:hypothetical protein DdX_16619 [Ditylenchus destructor]|uniref:Uncharacterized protein n=1 Tax=Ditylenchus destructor TaxID=166010 RepID=A0AAD4MT90_9BILA|nr:hypothetical protein DdX_16619 [Ditylenchus destructor]
MRIYICCPTAFYFSSNKVLVTFNLHVANGFPWSDFRFSHNFMNFSDGFSCTFYGYGVSDLVGCYMTYFGFGHEKGFSGAQHSVYDLQPIFDYIKIYTGCDLINEPNEKCKRKRFDGKWRPYIDRNDNSPESGEFPSQIPPFPWQAHLEVKSERRVVKISYKEDDISQESFKPMIPGNDGPHFPLPLTTQSTIKVEKRGRFKPKYKIEFSYRYIRVLLILTGKSKLWFRVHCYSCGSWIEVKSNCKERVIKSSAGGTIHVPLDNSNDEGGRCTLWKGGSNEETRRKSNSKAKSASDESLEEKTITEVEKHSPERKEFGDWILPPGVRSS